RGERGVHLVPIEQRDAPTVEAVDNLATGVLRSERPRGAVVRRTHRGGPRSDVSRAVSDLIFEGALGALLTGLMVFLFLRDPRGALIVILTIPIAIITAVITLHMMGQSINIMTLSGLALSIGIRVDEATVTIENIHQHMELGK